MNNSQEVENEKKLVDIRIWDLPEEDFNEWMKIVNAHGRNRQTAFRVLLNSYFQAMMFGNLYTQIQILEDRLKAVEEKWRKEGGNFPKTFGG